MLTLDAERDGIYKIGFFDQLMITIHFVPTSTYSISRSKRCDERERGSVCVYVCVFLVLDII